MNNNYSFKNEYEIDIKDLMWKFLAQWKAILLFCIIMALLTPGVRFLMDTKAYEKDAAEKAEAEKEASIPIDERIEKMLEGVSAEDAAQIRFILQQQDLIDLQQNYLSSSIFVNLDPTSQRQLLMKYQLKKTGDVDLQTLSDAFGVCFRRKSTLTEMRDVIAPDAYLEAINELVSVYGGQITDSEEESMIYTVSVILPDDADADAIVKITDSSIKAISKELNDTVGPHSISRLNVEDSHIFNTSISERRSSVFYTINNLTNNINTAKNRLSDESKELADVILALKIQYEEMEDTAESRSIEKESAAPSFSKKYAVLGFILGAFIYTFIFLLRHVFRKTLESADTALSITGKRLLGEAYIAAEHKGLSGLFSSKRINKIRYKEKLDEDAQAMIASDTISSVCAYHNVERLPLLASGLSEELSEVVSRIEEGCMTGDSKVKLDITDADKLDEKALSDMDKVIYLLSNNTRADKLYELLALCKEYDVQSLGTIYLEEV